MLEDKEREISPVDSSTNEDGQSARSEYGEHAKKISSKANTPSIKKTDQPIKQDWQEKKQCVQRQGKGWKKRKKSWPPPEKREK